MNVSFEFLLRSDGGNLPDTSNTSTINYSSRFMGYQKTCMTCRRTGDKETKAYPTILQPINNVNWRLPKAERQENGYV